MGVRARAWMASMLGMVVTATAAGCGGDSGLAEGFDVTGTWAEQGGDSSIEFTDTCGYTIRFSPPLGDGTTVFGGERYERLDNSTLSFRVVMGVSSLDVVDVVATVGGDEVLAFELDARKFEFVKSGGGAEPAPDCPARGAAGTPDGPGAGAIVETAPVMLTGAALPRLELGSNDAASGAMLPGLAGIDFSGEPVTIGSDGRAKVILVVAHWDPHSRAVVADLAAWVAEGGMPVAVDLYVVSTAAEPARDNYPPSAWLGSSGLDVPILVDDASGSAADALGLAAFPHWVFAGSDGAVAGRTAGRLTTGELANVLVELAGG